jgi:hypothetical protein
MRRLLTDEARLSKDEGAWLKSLGEVGDMARMMLQFQKQIRSLEKRISRHEQKAH